jgi:hypothetical protein
LINAADMTREKPAMSRCCARRVFASAFALRGVGRISRPVRRSSTSEGGRRNPPLIRESSAGYAEPVIGPRFARTRWLTRPTFLLTAACRKPEALICPTCPAPPAKINLFRFPELYDHLRPSRLHRRGVSRSSRTLAAGCGGRGDAPARASVPTKASLRTAKPYGPVPPTLGSSLAETFGKATVANKPGTPGRVRSSR